MASKMEYAHADDGKSLTNESTVIYVMPQRIQKKMLQDIKNAMKRNRFRCVEKFGEGVTHIVTEYSDFEQVLHQLQRDGADVSEEKSLPAHVVKLAWLSACLKAKTVLPIEDQHRLKPQPKSKDEAASAQQQGREQQLTLPAWACQRVTPLKHHNEKFTKALETLEQHADFRGGDSDYSRALAFRRASCVLKSLPFRVERLSQVEGLRDIGGHALRVIKSILEDGYCEEVESVCGEWFCLMKLFTSVFGVGPATAKKWIEKGFKSIEDVRKSDLVTKDERVMWGLAFHEDLTDPVTRKEADAFTRLVQQEAEALLPGVVVVLTGGFRRGKPAGHDVDVLMSHPDEGREQGLLPSLLRALEKKRIILMGRLEASTYHPDVLVSDHKLTNRGMLDHFEKWLGICKFDHSFRNSDGKGAENDPVGLKANAEGASETAEGKQKGEADTANAGSKEICDKDTPESGVKTGSSVQAAFTDKSSPKGDRNEKEKKHTEEQERPDGARKRLETQKRPETPVNLETQKRPDETERKHKPETKEEESDCTPQIKKQRTTSALSPYELASSERSWKARRVDLIVCPWSQYYYALVGWTGSKQFNRDLRLYAQKELNMKLTSHGLYDFNKNCSVPASSEAAVFQNLKLEYREPWERNC